MQITIDTTEEISNLDARILAMLVGGAGLPEPEDEPEPEPTPAPAKKAAAKKAAPKAEPKPEPEPEPMAEEPVVEPEDDVLGEEETSDEDLLALAVKKATEMVAAGDAPKVREALDAAGAGRVRELNSDNVRAFFAALP